MLIKKKLNYESLLREYFIREDFKEWYIDVKRKAFNDSKVTFYQSMANLIAQIGYAVDTVLLSPKIRFNSTLGSMQYLCLDILNDQVLYNFIEACAVNDNANISKHSTRNTLKVEIPDILHYYNKLIDKLSKALNSKAISNLKVILKKEDTRNIIQKTQALQDEKFELIGKHKLNIKLDNNFSFDKYSKTVTGKIIINCDDSSKIDEIFNIYLMSATDKSIKKGVQIGKNIVINPKETIKIPFTMSYNTIYKNNITTIFEFESLRDKVVTKKETRSYETGHLWWKRTVSYERDVDVVEKNKFTTKRITLKTKVNLK